MSLEQAEELIKKYAKNLTYTAACPEIIPVGGEASWIITHGLSTSNIVAGLFDSAGEVEKELEILTANKIKVTWGSNKIVNAGDYSILVVSGGASSGFTIDSAFSLVSTNPVQNAVITEAVGVVEDALYELNSGDGINGII